MFVFENKNNDIKKVLGDTIFKGGIYPIFHFWKIVQNAIFSHFLKIDCQNPTNSTGLILFTNKVQL